MIRSKKQMYIVVSAFAIILMLFTTTYAFFNYTRTGTANVIRTGRIAFNTEQGDTVTLSDLFPIQNTGNITSATPGVGSLSIHVTGDTTYESGLEYKVTAVNVTSASSGNELPISIEISYDANGQGKTVGEEDEDYFTNRGGNSSIYKLLSTDTITDGGDILVGYIASGETGIDGNINIIAYLDAANIAITDTIEDGDIEVPGYINGTDTDWINGRTVFTTEEWNALQTNGVSFQIKIEANESVWVEEPPILAEQMVRNSIANKINAETNSCNPIWIDNFDTASDDSDDVTYFSGNNDCIDMNYVWYSGKLWRITAIYPDGSMKLVTEGLLTLIPYGEDGVFNGSWVYQWLNEDFYDTLVNTSNIIKNDAEWNNSSNSDTPIRPELVDSQRITKTAVGMLNSYEYYNAYRNSSFVNNYLNIGYEWASITPKSNISYVYVINNEGYLANSSTPYSMNVRPSIVIKSGLIFTGEGTKSSPYIINGDREKPIENVTLVNSRSVGEYVLFNNEVYRIVNTDGGTTKLTQVNYFNNNGTQVKKYFASTPYFGKSTNIQSDSYWDYYLNNTWYNSLSQINRNMLTDGTYYLESFGGTGNYKKLVCKDTQLDTVTIKSCTKYTSNDADKTFTGKVGLSRIGEMFATQLGQKNNSTSLMWTITPYSTWQVIDITDTASSSHYGSSAAFGSENNVTLRPSITLKQSVKITGGEGLESNPFTIGE